MFNHFAHAGHDHTEDTSTEVKTNDEQTYQTAAVAEDKPPTDFSIVPYVSGGILTVVLTSVIIGILFLSSKKKPTGKK